MQLDDFPRKIAETMLCLKVFRRTFELCIALSIYLNVSADNRDTITTVNLTKNYKYLNDYCCDKEIMQYNEVFVD